MVRGVQSPRAGREHCAWPVLPHGLFDLNHKDPRTFTSTGRRIPDQRVDFHIRHALQPLEHYDAAIGDRPGGRLSTAARGRAEEKGTDCFNPQVNRPFPFDHGLRFTTRSEALLAAQQLRLNIASESK